MVRRMRLERITPENYEAALALSVRPDQEDLVGPVVKSWTSHGTPVVIPKIAGPASGG
ncbi:hypothetical protein SAMN05443287_102345 [Micromonospora phaseoli]|uniref:Uncharacterized protein n=1 Tax=Micromonospora phaseoli TaxID=1144548 RepID=A0A1H6UQF7_9ACTN|nr:hypothetical protein CLV64_104346 [Micromonospora phaseoli]GIJ78690.1 hypothetical protein Xph01_31220 [Micromonospora phaseoli]SEI94559.1 hypothetical protein SAMN05443287_102345 [Micromonospora phaseoli]